MSVVSRIQEARDLLEAFGMDAERSNERSALVLLSLLELRPNDPWSKANATQPKLIMLRG